jgi:hypothetical protein
MDEKISLRKASEDISAPFVLSDFFVFEVSGDGSFSDIIASLNELENKEWKVIEVDPDIIFGITCSFSLNDSDTQIRSYLNNFFIFLRRVGNCGEADRAEIIGFKDRKNGVCFSFVSSPIDCVWKKDPGRYYLCVARK